MTVLSDDAVTRGELHFAIVESFNSADNLQRGDGSGDMTGTVRLMDGTVLPFAYVDGRFPVYDDIKWDEDGYSPAKGGYGMSWPSESVVLMVEVTDSRVRRWTWPGLILGNARKVNDHRYLEQPRYRDGTKLRGLHCLVDRRLIATDDVEGLVKEWRQPLHHFPRYAAYVGHYADGYMPYVECPERYVVFRWDALSSSSCYVAGTIAPH